MRVDLAFQAFFSVESKQEKKQDTPDSKVKTGMIVLLTSNLVFL